MIQRSREVIAVFDSSKVNKRALAFITMPDQLDTVVTDTGMDKATRNQLKAMNVNVIAVRPDSV
jgi:DeoR/GlpR family transcriptional regulator of sugar metabolism